MVAIPKQVHHGDVGSHARGAGDCELGVFHAGEGPLEAGSCGIAASCVVKDDWIAGRWLRKGRTQMNSWGNATENLIGFISSMDESGGYAPG